MSRNRAAAGLAGHGVAPGRHTAVRTTALDDPEGETLMHLITASITPQLRSLLPDAAASAIRGAVQVPVEHVYVQPGAACTLVGAFVSPGPRADMTACVQATIAALSILAGPDHLVHAEAGEDPLQMAAQ